MVAIFVLGLSPRLVDLLLVFHWAKERVKQVSLWHRLISQAWAWQILRRMIMRLRAG